MSPPYVRSPREVPWLREWLMYQWGANRAFHRSAGLQMLGRPMAPERGVMDEIAAWNHGQLADAELWWVDEGMVDLVEHSSTDLPEFVLQEEAIPAQAALCVLERPLQGVDADIPENPVLVDAISWGRSLIGDVPAVSTVMYQRMPLDGSKMVGRGGAIVIDRKPGDAMPDDVAWVPMGRSDWPIGKDWTWRVPDVSDLTHASLMEDRRWLATLWALAAQPRISVEMMRQADRAERRRAERAGMRSPDVKVVALRHSVYEAAGAERLPYTDGSGRRYRVRWPVKGHWRQQPYGPERQYRRPQFIAPYIKGPEGAPLRTGATVRVLRES